MLMTSPSHYGNPALAQRQVCWILFQCPDSCDRYLTPLYSICLVGPREGGTGIEVLVQGNHAKATVDLLITEGVPQKWIETVDLTKKKK